jgi:hypothetical protein
MSGFKVITTTFQYFPPSCSTAQSHEFTKATAPCFR